MFFNFNRHIFVRNIDADDLLESFLVSAIASLLAIRFFLRITDYPQIGGKSIHFSHIILGGLLMTMALILLLVFLSKPINKISAVIGGIGFGAFIDELGKFITKDNDYFFQPAVAIIYVIFIFLYLSLRTFRRYTNLSKKEYTVNALEYIKEAILNNLSDQEKEMTFELLKKSGSDDLVVIELKKILHQFDAVSLKRLSLIAKAKQFLNKFYFWLIKRKHFVDAVIVFFIIHAVIVLFRSLMMFIVDFSKLSFIQWGDLIFSAIPGILAIIGAFTMRQSRLKAYLIFKYAVLVSIFLTQFFAFYEEQFIALIGLFIDVFVFLTLRYMISQETQIQKSGNL